MADASFRDLAKLQKQGFYLDLFSGIGGFALGAYNAGLRFNEHYFSEVDEYASSVYRARFTDAIPLGDIRAISGVNLPKGNWILSGGFPCQDISVAGKGAGLAGERSGLWYEYARLIGELRPRYAIMENVGALAFRGLDSVLGSLAALGYDAEWQDIRASDVGAPHRRERIWIISYPAEGRGENNKRVQSRIGMATVPIRASGAFQPSGTYELHSPGNYDFRYGKNNGISTYMDRAECLGNSIVPQIAEMIFNQDAFDEWRIA